MRPVHLLLALCLLAVGVTGCLSGDETDSTSSEEGNHSDLNTALNGSSPGPSDSLLTFDGFQEPYTASMWENGTISTQETCLGGGCVASFGQDEPSFYHPVDITEIAPPNVPVQVTANLSWENRDTPVFNPPLGQFTLFVAATEGTIYAEEQTSDLEWTRVTSTLVRQTSGTASVVINAGMADPQGTSYTLNITTTVDPTHIPADVPVAVPVTTPNATPTLQVTAGENASLEGLHWGPEDTLLERQSSLTSQTHWVLNETTPTGEHVIALLGNGQGARVSANASNTGPLRALTLTTEIGEPHPVSPQGQASWTFPVESLPYAAGLYTKGSQAGQTEVQAEMQLSTPKGPLLAMGPMTDLCLACTSDTPDDEYFAEPGHPAMVEGEWSVSYDGEAATNTDIGTLLVRYVR